ncbi:MAG TPA: hypothetical protein VKG38_10035 [Solirubrobacteraceae bacterium]|nr:hypothetical protein [Solirubrobacteraceae bacterium]
MISNLGGTARQVSCPWCRGSGTRVPGIDAQAHWSEPSLRQDKQAQAEGQQGEGEQPEAPTETRESERAPGGGQRPEGSEGAAREPGAGRVDAGEQPAEGSPSGDDTAA